MITYRATSRRAFRVAARIDRLGKDDTTPMRLLIAKLTSTTVQSVSVSLTSGSDVVDLATDLDGCVRLLRAGTYDLALMIISHQRPRAREALARLRQETARLPMIVLTEQTRPASDPIAATEAGPTSDPGEWRDEIELRALAASAFARARPAPVLDAETQMLRAGDLTVSLSQAETRLFARLWGERGRIVSAEDLLSAIYADTDRPASRVLPVFLFKLRRKLAMLGLPELIETAVGRGFMIRGAPAEAARALRETSEA